MLRPFIYRRYIDFSAIDSIRNMKRLIARELHRRGMAANIKLGPGGIREIEFIGQAFQLVRGGRDTDLQVRPILTVLERLGAKGLLPAFAVRELREAYEFLRLTENRIQAWKDEQNHKLPADPAGRERLARSMDYPAWPQFAADLERHRERVQQHFEQVFAAPQTEEEGAEPALAAVWSALESPERLALRLQDAGYREPQAALERIVAFRDSAACRALSARGRERLDALMPMLLDAVGGADAPDATLERLLRLLGAVVRRTAYLDLLVENPLALSQLVRLGGESPWIVSQLIRQPILLDELLDARRLYTPLRRRDLEAELDVMLGQLAADDLEQQMERLRQFAQGNMLRVAAADLADVIPLRVVSDYLTEIAEVVLGRATAIAWDHLVAKHGRPTDILGDQTGFAVIGYGKLGGIELGYGSDLDLVFLHGSREATAMTEGVDGRRQIANDVFYARMGQRLIHLLTTRTPSGILYEVDMRLRPNGNAGMLVSSLNAFERYQENEAWTWEHQALLRARPVAGDPAVMARFAAIRREVLGRARDPEQLSSDVRQMRAKMREALDRSTATEFDLKQGRGGIADIEFMVQYAILRWAHQHPDLLDWSDNLRLLEGLARHALLEGQAAELLANAYQVFRAVYHRNALREAPGLMPDDQLAEERRLVREIWQDLMGEPA
jgi:glutamate-ammonia-ligase adenylyltransferase